MMNQRFTFTLPARYCSSKISRFQSFHLPPRRLSSLPLHLQCPRWRRPQRWQRVEEAGTCGGAPSLPSVTASSSSSPSSLDSTLPSPNGPPLLSEPTTVSRLPSQVTASGTGAGGLLGTVARGVDLSPAAGSWPCV